MLIADLHIHSRYSRATSSSCMPQMLDLTARKKGIHILGSGDFTHPAWRDDLRRELTEAEDGLYRLREELRLTDSGLKEDEARPRFIISGEISCIYKQDGKVRKVHNVILLPSFAAAENLSARLEALGCNLRSDGRPIIGMSSHDLLELTLDVCETAIFIPAHIWTPHFSALGAYSGFDSIDACYGDLTPYIHAVETGLSSDPPMNWRLSGLDGFTLVSNSDAHSPGKLAREANIFHCDLSYTALAQALVKGNEGFGGTIEFFPEEGKYHYDGHRDCRLSLHPAETLARGGLCPVCGKPVTVGVLHRAVELADRKEGYIPEGAAPYQSLAPLTEVIAACSGIGSASKKAAALYDKLLYELGPELGILMDAPLELIERSGGVCLAEGVKRLRAGQVRLIPGYDGQYGHVGILDSAEIAALSGQTSLFDLGRDIDGEKNSEQEKPQASRQKAAAPSKAEPSPERDAYPYGLNGEQWLAASATEGAIAVLAGPGSGKTRTLISRIAWLIEEQNVPPQQITAVTFTNKAARELRQRLDKHFRDKKISRGLHVGTFHAICREILTEARGPFRLLDPYQARGVAAQVIAELGLKQSPTELISAVSRIKAGKSETAKLTEAANRYGELLRHYNALDFDDLLLQALALYTGEKPPSRERFRYLLVDEFQDINDIQFRLIMAWAGDDPNLFVIGDPEQAIYGFRGADQHCFQRLVEKRPDLRELNLRRNYRCAPAIAAAAAALLQHHSPPPCSAHQAGAVILTEPESALSEGIFIAQEIDRLVGGVDMLSAHRGKKRIAEYGFSDMAVLCRTHRQTELIGQCLDKQGVPFIVSGKDDFLSDKAVQSCLAFLRLLLDPKDALSADVLRAEIGTRRLDALTQRFAPIAKKTHPAQLVEAYSDELHLDGNEAMARLRQMALLHGKTADLLRALSSHVEADISYCGGAEYRNDAVALSTLHAAKGLEFPVVFIAGLREGLLPFAAAQDDAAIAEEKRLLYVGMTRAAQRLLLLAGNPPSRFIAELPPEYIEKDGAISRRRKREKQLSLFDK